MDYLFIIEFNDQNADPEQLKQTISGYGADIRYLESDVHGTGIVGIVRFAAEKTDTARNDFFDQIRELVAGINNLPQDKVTNRTLTNADLPPAASAKWARASIENVLVGFDVEGTPLINSDSNPYQIITTLKGGIGGKD